MKIKESNTRLSHTKEAIQRDFAEHLKYTIDADIYHTTPSNRFTALAYAIRDRIIHQWDISRKTQRGSKRVYYLSLEFLMGRAMTNNLINMRLEDVAQKALMELGYTYEELADCEMDAGLGNGGLGRLAACFLDSMATMEIPCFGYGIRYNYGIFRQQITNGYQAEQPDRWLRNGNPWEIARPDLVYTVNFGGEVRVIRENERDSYKWVNTKVVNGMAYDMPIIGYGGKTVNTLRLWSAKAADDFSFKEFNEGDYTQAVRQKISAENISQVLYPNDTAYMGKVLRLEQQYFFVACSLADMTRRFKRERTSWSEFPAFAAIQLNDTHPSIAIAELMRILVDQEGLDWDPAWEITQSVMGYTNHTLLPEALEKWPVPMFEELLPRHLQIIYEINARFLQKAVSFFPFAAGSLSKVSIIEESSPKQIRMANLAIIGSHATNGVAELHSELLRTKMFPEFSTIYPDRFTNVTNGITQRRWLLAANPGLAKLITSAIGDGWITDFSQISKLKGFADDPAFLDDFAKVKRGAKDKACRFLKDDCSMILNPDTVFDTQIKRIHEYKRQLMNALSIILTYHRLKNDSSFRQSYHPTTFLFGGKAAPGYTLAKLIIKFICNISAVINSDKDTSKLINVFFMPNYRVTMAEAIIPATNLSEQISTAGMEASGTGNMKFMCNGAVTIGTLDGANIEIAREVGDENIFIFGKTESQLAKLRASYDPYEIILSDPQIKSASDLILSGYFNVSESGIFLPLQRALLDEGDRFFVLEDLKACNEASLKANAKIAQDPRGFDRMAVMNIASSAKFSSDRSIEEYASRIWHVDRCPVKINPDEDHCLNDARKR